MAPALLALQDEDGADVLLVLHLLFLAAHGRVLDEAGIARLDAAALPWRGGVIEALRAIRRIAPPAERPDWPRLRAQIQKAELEAERQQMAFLLGVDCPTENAASPGAAGAANLAGYAALLGRPVASFGPLLEMFGESLFVAIS